MTVEEVRVNLESGLHARPATKFVNLAKGFRSKITISHNGKTADPKSIIALLSLNVQKGNIITIAAEGEDEAQAVAALSAYARETE
ncbi:MAG: HPr family phosphocarrier protein [Clostridiaceae bacterium]|jgi:phosphotransferase system HPr (HPr) family protein|nr:HPr family phosphocarrier protein [Clostridiaceae bacterium]